MGTVWSSIFFFFCCGCPCLGSQVKGVDSSTEGSSSHLEETPVSKPGTVEGSKKPEGSSHTPSKRGRSKKTSNRGRGKAEHRPLNADASSSRGSVSVGSRSVEGKGLGSSVSGTSLGGAAPVASTRDATPSVEVDSPQRGGVFLFGSFLSGEGNGLVILPLLTFGWLVLSHTTLSLTPG